EFEKEFIFIDDGSTDRSLERLHDLTTGRQNCIIVSEENVGPSGATNKGLARATGDFIKLVDGDDILASDMTAALLSAAKQSGCPVVIGEKGSYSMQSGKPDEFLRPEKTTAYTLQQPLKKLLKNAFFTPTHMLFRRELLEHSGGCDERVFIQDYSIALRLARVSGLAMEPAAVFFAPRIAEGRMSDNTGQILHDLNAALYGFFRDYPDQDPQLLTYGIRRATGRAWHWAKRNSVSNKVRIESLLAFIKGRMPGFNKCNIEMIRRSCRIFQLTQTIRQPLL
ncbi:MAG: glycosyltransferase, partial [Thiotrichales bacterium]|nr:glycosyltransferase [Thiotrichales bacterium]